MRLVPTSACVVARVRVGTPLDASGADLRRRTAQ
jgi:hypothetical protein